MSHYRRKRSRTRGVSHGYYDSTNWGNHWPRWWDILYHRRPARRATAAIEHKVLTGAVDPDDVAWPVSKKPHVYYW